MTAEDLQSFDRRLGREIGALIAELGVDRSGAYAYYKLRADTGSGLSNYECALAEDIARRHDPAGTQVLHPGCGFATLGMYLAQSGYRVLGFERDTPRFRGASALAARLGGPAPPFGGRLALREGLYPAALLPGDLSPDAARLLLFTNVGAGWTEADESAVVATFSRFDEVILDLRLFGRVRDDPADRQALLDRILAASGGNAERIVAPATPAYVRIRGMRR